MSKRYCIDIDGTICTPTVGRDYHKAEPWKDRIAKINTLYDSEVCPRDFETVLELCLSHPVSTLRMCCSSRLAASEEVTLTHNIVAVEDRPGLVPGDRR